MTGTINRQVFKGEKVYLGPAKKEDNEIIWKWYQDQEYYQMAYGGSPYAITLESIEKEEAKFNDDNTVSEFRIRENGTDRLVGLTWLSGIDRSFGTSHLSVNIGNPEDRGKGYGSEAIRLICSYAFKELRLHRVALVVYQYNDRAFELYKRLGFKEEGRAREAIYRNGRYFDCIQMGMLEGELKA
ncbi:MAG: GNAT family N-acetyltransferase [Chloroflexi bacterium]|nr:GNAT family N-acetyltransferase [Chloroflexota bacterium]OJV86963.1 MAG: hypothetical protein BGO39_28585 [Chloroflexi bacterium 54-19]